MSWHWRSGSAVVPAAPQHAAPRAARQRVAHVVGVAPALVTNLGKQDSGGEGAVGAAERPI